MDIHSWVLYLDTVMSKAQQTSMEQGFHVNSALLWVYESVYWYLPSSHMLY